MPRLSLRTAAILFTVALLLFTGTGGMLAAYSFFAKRSEEMLREEAQRDSVQLVWLAEQFFSLQPDLLRAALMRHALEKGELATALLDENGQVLLASQREWEGAAGSILPGFHLDTFTETVRRQGHGERADEHQYSFYLAWRIAPAPAERWGALYLAYDKRTLAQTIATDLWHREGVVLLLAILMMPGAFLLIDRFALRPLAQLRDQLDELSRGGRQHIVPSGGKEIVELGQAINRMTERLAFLDKEKAKERALFSEGPVTIFLWQMDTAWTILEVTDNVAFLLGMPADAMRGQSFIEWVSHTERERLIAAASACQAAHHGSFVQPFSLRRADGTVVWVECHARPEYDERGCCARLRGYLLDVSQLILSRQREEIHRQAWQNLREAIMVTDAEGVIEAVNPAFTTITGYAETEVTGKTTRLLKSGLHDADFYADLWQQLRAHGLWSGYIWNKRKNGELFMAEMSIAAVADDDGKIRRYIALFADATPLRSALEKADWAVTHDRLTGLANRTLFLQRLGHLCSRASVLHAAILVFDLLRFRDINDSHGESVGNHILSQIAGRLELQAPTDALIARLGSDEFAVLLPTLPTSAEEAAQHAYEAAKSLQKVVETPIPYDDLEPISLRVAIGIRLFHPGDPSCRLEADGALLGEAHLALIEAKASPSRIAFFERKLSEAIQQRVKMEQELRAGIAAGQLRLYLQPQRDRLRRIRGFEALVRWQHPEKGLLSPGAFFAAAESGGLMPAIDDWMLSATLACIAAATREGHTLTIACNLGPFTFDRGGVAEKIEERLAAHGVAAANLVIELTENALFRDEESVARELERIAQLGVRIAIDDFGTGYSSLARLHNLPIHELKIDRSFVGQLPGNPQAEKIVRTLIELAEALAMTVVAEGVEIEAQAEYLDGLASLLQQGYFHGKPASAEAWLAHLPVGEGMR